MKTDLGLLKQIDDLKEVWRSEAKDFTPWLAEENNLQQLGNTIGLDLELDEIEKNVGPYRADILCREPGTDHFILIENQIEKTDHTHLGQILTYAAGLKAVTIVWIAKRFTDEHRAAIDWLNTITDNDFSFFGLEIELWRIGNSPIAPKFNIVSKPNEWTKGGGSVATGSKNLSPTKTMQLEYWTKFREYVLQHGTLIRPQKASAQHWMNFSIGRTGFYMYSFMDTQKERVGIRLVMDGENAKPYYKLLQQQKKAINKEFGLGLEWQELPNKKNSYISIYNNSLNPKKKKDWTNQFTYFLEKLEKYHKVFSQRIKSLDIGDLIEEEED
ncbi:MAG: DUF4268 domain-containing protein [Victivallaceae bacterium]|nr:DUF4268 domain-containing protein [Victivallaceae bacterium]